MAVRHLSIASLQALILALVADVAGGVGGLAAAREGFVEANVEIRYLGAA